MTNEDFIEYAYNFTNYLNSKGINFIVQPWMIWTMFPITVLIFFFFIPAVIHHAKNKKKAKNAKTYYTAMTTGTVIRIDEEKHIFKKDDGSHDYYYTKYAIVQYKEGNKIRVSEDLTRTLEVGDVVTVYYDPIHPEKGMIEDDIEEGMKDNWFKGILDVLAALAMFVALVITIMFFTGFFN